MSTHTERTSSTKQRKAKHLSICTNPREYTIEHDDAGFGGIRFVHQALPEISAASIDTTESFLGHEIAAPVFISCMTGGSEEGFRVNRDLAIAAERLRVPVGMGSIRVLFEHEEVFDHFHLKRFAPSVPVLANIGGVQVRDLPRKSLVDAVKRLEADALVIHLNPGQELFQPDGDRDFRGIREAIAEMCEESPFPVIVKETGFGIAPAVVRDLLGLGVSYVDVAGGGGTNWVSVEGYRGDEELQRETAEFDTWGIPTAHLLAAIRYNHGNAYDGRILASGGLRAGQDLAKSIALGAKLAGMALPLVRAEVDGGVDAVVSMVERMIAVVRAVMTLTSSVTVADLRRAPLYPNASFQAETRALAEASARSRVRS